MSGGRGRRAALLSVLVAIACLAVPAFATAHARLIQSVPQDNQIIEAAPEAVTLTFSEPIEDALSTIRVFDGSAVRVDQGQTTRTGSSVLTTRLQASLAAGTYTVSWRVASADGHPIDGAFVFHVGAPGARPEGIAGQVASTPPTAVARAADVARFLNVALVVALIGAIAANLLIFAGRDPDVARRMWYVVAGLGFGLSIVAAATVVLHAATVAGAGLGQATSGSTLSAVLDTRFGHVRLTQLVLSEVIAVGAVWASSSPGAWLTRGIGLLGTGLAVTPGLAGHAGASSALAVVADTTHVLAASVWVGGLGAMMVGLALASGRRLELARQAFPRYSLLAVGSVAVLLVSGTIGGFVHIGQVSDLWDTTYGKLLIGKVVFVSALIGVGVANRVRVRRLAAGAPAGVLGGLRRSVVVELALMAVAIGVTSVLIDTPPSRAVAAARSVTVAATGQVADLSVRLVADPGTVGPNLLHVYLTRDGSPQRADEVAVTAKPLAGTIGPFRLTAAAQEPGHYVTPRLEASVGGLWAFQVAVRRGEFDLDSASLELPIGSR